MVAARWGSTHEACKSIGRAHQDDGRGRFCAANYAPFGTDPLLGDRAHLEQADAANSGEPAV
jgi:hypothetical protein